MPGRIRRFCQGLRFARRIGESRLWRALGHLTGAPLAAARFFGGKEAGSTTLDILTAMAITLTLAAIVVPSVSSQIRNARDNALIGDIETIRNNLIKFFSDTQQMPILEDGLVFEVINRSGTEKINGVKGLTSGLLLNDKPIISWRGPYTEKEIFMNPFMGTYFLDYSTIVTTSQGELATSAVLVVTNVPLAEITTIDETVDDGDPQDGNIQIASSPGKFLNQMVVVILEDTVIDPATGLPNYKLSGTSLD